MADPVLVVDDNAETREAVVRLLQIRGHSVVTAGDGQEALEYLSRGGRASLIVLDVYMPRVDGHGFRTAQLRDQKLAGIPVIVFSVAVSETLPDVAAFVRKSEPAALLRQVEGVLAARSG